MRKQLLILPEPFVHTPVPFSTTKGESVMNSIVWLVGAVVIVIAVLNLVGFA
jgi:hypothetical protein